MELANQMVPNVPALRKMLKDEAVFAYAGEASLSLLNENIALPDHKALLVKGNLVAVVGSTYKIVQTQELFDSILDVIEKTYPDVASKPVTARCTDAYDGGTQVLDMILHGRTYPTRRGREVAWRIILLNGHGRSAIRIFTGAIDTFCTNGSITGDFEAIYAKHSSGLTINKLTEKIAMLSKSFDAYKVWTEKLEAVYLTFRDLDLHAEELVKEGSLSERTYNAIREKILEDVGLEPKSQLALRHVTGYQVLAGATAWATHFTPRKTKHDHFTVTAMDRQKEALKITTLLLLPTMQQVQRITA